MELVSPHQHLILLTGEDCRNKNLMKKKMTKCEHKWIERFNCYLCIRCGRRGRQANQANVFWITFDAQTNQIIDSGGPGHVIPIDEVEIGGNPQRSD